MEIMLMLYSTKKIVLVLSEVSAWEEELEWAFKGERGM